MWPPPQRSHTVTFMWYARLSPQAPSTPNNPIGRRDPRLRFFSFGPFSFKSFGVLLLAAAAALAAVPSQAQSQAASTALAALRPKPMRRVAANPDFRAKVQLAGHLPGWVRTENTAAEAVPVSAPLQ